MLQIKACTSWKTKGNETVSDVSPLLDMAMLSEASVRLIVSEAGGQVEPTTSPHPGNLLHKRASRKQTFCLLASISVKGIKGGRRPDSDIMRHMWRGRGQGGH